MEKTVLAGASWEKQKYFYEPKYNAIPNAIKDELRNICVLTAEKLRCTFLMTFEKNGDLMFEVIKNEGDFNFDDIYAELLIKKLRSENKELINSLKLWYVIHETEDGERVKEEMLKNSKEE